MGRYVKKADRDRIPGGPLARHGGYSVAHKDELIRRRPEIRLYLKVVRRGLIRDVCPEGEEHLTMARHIVLDRLMQKLATARLIEEYLAEHGILKPKANRKLLEAQHITTLWLALNNQIREDLKLLGLDRRPLEAIVLSTSELVDAVAEERAAARAKETPTQGQGEAQAGQSACSSGDGEGGDGQDPGDGGPGVARDGPGKALEPSAVAQDGPSPGDEAGDMDDKDAPSGGEDQNLGS